MTTQFDTIYYGPLYDAGKFRVAASGVAWRAGEFTTAISANEIKWVQWSRVARGFRIRVGTTSGKESFDGFGREHHDKLATLFKKHFSITLESRESAFKGWNWGTTDFQGSDELIFTVSDKAAFELPLSNVSNANISGKNEVSLEFGSLGTNASKQTLPDELVEIRFYIPASSKEKEHRGSESDNEDDLNPAEVFHKTVQAKASKDSQGTSTVILNFEEVLLLTPRGRYDMDMYSDSLRLRGKTYDYRVLYSNISRVFLLPKDTVHLLFIIGLKSPIRQGQTRYDYLVIQFERSEEMSAELQITGKEVEKHPLLKQNYDGPTFEVVADVFRALVRKKIIGSSSFKSHGGTNSAIKANLKAVLGELFMLEKYIFFVTKQSTLIELRDIHSVAFSRVGRMAGVAAARTFDLKIVTRSGPEYIFTLISQDEHRPIEAYLKERKVNVKNDMAPNANLHSGDSGSGSDDVFDTNIKNLSKVTRGRTDNDEDSEEDLDFQGSTSDAGSTSESGSSDGGADTASDASGDREFSGPKIGTAVAKKAKLQKKGNNDDGNRTNDNGTKTQPIPAAAHDQPRVHPKPQPPVSEGRDGDVERPKKKLKVRA